MTLSLILYTGMAIAQDVNFNGYSIEGVTQFDPTPNSQARDVKGSAMNKRLEMRAALDRKRHRKNFYWKPDKVAPLAPSMRDEKGRQAALRHKASHDAHIKWEANRDTSERVITNTVHRDAVSYKRALRELAAEPKVMKQYVAAPLPHESTRNLKAQALKAISE